MKIAIITANFGGYDTVHPAKEQSIDCDYYYFTEKNSPYPLAGLNNRMKAKFFKLQAHVILKGYDVIIWHDASIKIESSEFAKFMVDQLGDNNIALPIHPKRPNLEEELLFIMDGINHKDPYLCARYSHAAIKAEYEFLQACKVEHLTLFACGLIAFKPTSLMTSFMNAWWECVLLFSEFDQCLFSFVFENQKKGRFEFNEPFNKKLISRTEHERH